MTTLTKEDYEGKSLAEVLSMKAGQAPEATQMPIGVYGATIVGLKQGESQNKKTPYIALVLKVTRASEAVMEDEDFDPSRLPRDEEFPFWHSSKDHSFLARSIDDFLINTMGAISSGQEDETTLEVLERMVDQEVGVVYGEKIIPADPAQGREARTVVLMQRLVSIDAVDG